MIPQYCINRTRPSTVTIKHYPNVLCQRSSTAAIVGLVPKRSCCMAAFALRYDLYQGFGTCINLYQTKHTVPRNKHTGYINMTYQLYQFVSGQTVFKLISFCSIIYFILMIIVYTFKKVKDVDVNIIYFFRTNKIMEQTTRLIVSIIFRINKHSSAQY